MKLSKLPLFAAVIIICCLLFRNSLNALALYRDDLSIEEAAQLMEAERAKIELNKKKIEEKQKEAPAFKENKKETTGQQKSSAALKESRKEETANQQRTLLSPKTQLHSSDDSLEKKPFGITVLKDIGIILLFISIFVLLKKKERLFPNKGKNDRN